MMLSPTKGFIEKHHVLVARIVVQLQQSTNIPIRVFNPGAALVILKRGAMAGFFSQQSAGAGEAPATKGPSSA
ncbi:unnamed protein product [Merluccius merluccius]